MKGLLSTYIHEAMERASYKVLEDGTYFGEIPGLQGVWASGATQVECHAELQEVLEEWLVLKLRDSDAIPV
ncbi:MAG: type II toxin-antitoxin system HicB family antitoxin [Chloroflexi bacterium]|nr:type II toxin-antitoxin system HicB family antitoxin [Chloroflexota bacterium]